MDDPLSLIVWAFFFYSASIFPLGLMLGSACCGCSGDERVKCFSPTHRCFRRLNTFTDGRKTAESQYREVRLLHEYIRKNGPSILTSSVFVSHESFSFPLSPVLSGFLAQQLSFGETASIVPAFTLNGNVYGTDGDCYNRPYVSEALSGEDLLKSVQVHGWDYPLVDSGSRKVSLGAVSGLSGVLTEKRNAQYNKNAALSHVVVGVRLTGGGIVANATGQSLAASLSVNVSQNGEYHYAAAFPANVFAYSTTGGTIEWTVRVFHGQAAHDDIVSFQITPSGTPDPDAVVFNTAGILISPPPLVNSPPPSDYYADGIYHVWCRKSSGNISTSPVNLSASQTSFERIGTVGVTWTYSQNPLGWTAAIVNTINVHFSTFTFPEGNYFHAGFLEGAYVYPCYTRDSDAVAAFMSGDAGLIYSNGAGDQSEFRLEPDNPLCGLDVTHLPATLLPGSVTVSHPDGESLYQTPCGDCPPTVSLNRTSNSVYFAPAADMLNARRSSYYYSNRVRTYSGESTWLGLYGNYQETLFAVTLREAIGHSDAISYLEGFFADSTNITWSRGGVSNENDWFSATCTIGGEDFLDGFDTPLVKHVTSHETNPRTIGVHGHKGVYPHSSYKVEVAVSDVEVVTEWERTSYHSDHRVVRKWLVNGNWTTTPTEGVRWQDFLEFISDSYPDQEGQHDLPTTKKDLIIDGIKSAETFVDEVFLDGAGTYGSNHPRDWVLQWEYRRGDDNFSTTYRKLKCDETFQTDPPLGRTPTYVLSEPVGEDGEGLVSRFSSAWSFTYNTYGHYQYPNQISLADELPPPPDEIPEINRTFPFNFWSGASATNFFWLNGLYGSGRLVVPIPPNDEDSYEVAFYQSLSTYVTDAEIETVPYTLEYSDREPFNGRVGKPGVPQESYGVYLLKVTLSVSATKGEPPSESCNVAVSVGNPDTPVGPLSKEDVTFTFSTECSMPLTFRGNIWPHAGVPANYYWLYGYYGYYGVGTSLTSRTNGHVFHLTGNDPDGSADDLDVDFARTPYGSHPFSPINVGETLYPYPQSAGYRPGTREGSWQGHIYVQGEQYDDLTYSYQYLSQLSVDRCETNKANWSLLVDRNIPTVDGSSTGRQVQVAMSRDAKLTVVGWYVPGETVRVGYISHKQYGRQSSSSGGLEETFPGSGWYPTSRYYRAAGGYLPAGMVTPASETTCDSTGRFSIEFNDDELDGDISVFVQPVSPATGRGLIEYVRSTQTLEECRDDWTHVTAVYVTKSISAPTSVVPYAEAFVVNHAAIGGYVVGRHTSVRLAVQGMIKESSVPTRVRLYDFLTSRHISQTGVGDGDFDTGLVTITGDPPYYSSSGSTSGANAASLWFTPNFLFADGQVIQVAAVMEDDLGNESPPVLMSGLIRMDYTSPTLDVVYVNGVEYTGGWLYLNDISKQTPVVISGVTEPGCKVKIGNDEAVSAGVVTALATTGTGVYSLPTTYYDSPVGTSRSGTLTATDVAKNSRSKTISVWNRLPDVQYARISGGLMECRLTYVQRNATVYFMFIRSDGAESPVLTVSAASGTADGSFTDEGFSPDFLYMVSIKVVIPNGNTVFEEQRNVVPV